MKKTATFLISLSFLFALSAIIIAIAGTYKLKTQANDLAIDVQTQLDEIDEASTTKTPALPEGYELNENQDIVSLVPEELGFTFSVPNEWGAFNLTYTPGPFKGSGTYAGHFENIDIALTATDPTFVPGRGGYYGDILGYRKTKDGYEANLLTHTWDLLPDRLTQGEVTTKNGTVLIVASDPTDGPMMFSDAEDVRFALFNTTVGPLPGGTFRAGSDVTRDEFRDFLESLEFIVAE